MVNTTRRTLLFFMLFVVIGLAGCIKRSQVFVTPISVTITPISTITSVKTPLPSFLPTSTPIPQPSPTILQSDIPSGLSHYLLQVDFDYNRHLLQVVETLTYVNHSSDDIQELLLIVEANRWKDCFILKDISWQDGQPVKEYRLTGAKLLITLPNSLPPQKNIVLKMAYHLRLPYQANYFGYTRHQTNLGNWYIFAPIYRSGEGWLYYEPAEVGEYVAYDLADFSVELRLVSAIGEVTIASSAPVKVKGNIYYYEYKAGRNFTLSASKEYVTVWNRVGDITIIGYVFPEHFQSGVNAAAYVADALGFYSELFGPYVHSQFTFIEADFPDGMEYDGLFFLDLVYFAHPGKGYSSGLATLSAHEVAHQWWGMQVANDQAKEPWLDESIATFSELLFYESLHPELVDWWWTYRVKGYAPSGLINDSIYRQTSFRDYVNATYLRGTQFLNDLRPVMGEEKFMIFLQDYFHQNRWGFVRSDDFFSALKNNYRGDLDPLLHTYFRLTPVPQ